MAADDRLDASEIGFLHRLIASTRRLLRAAWTATGLGITVGLGLVLLVTVALADLAMAFREGLRLTGLLLVVVPSGWAFLNGVLRPLFRRMTSRFVARRIESTLPGIHNRLVSVVDLDSDKQKKFSLAFVRRLITEAFERVKNFKPLSVVDQAALKRAALFAVIGLLVFATALGIFSDRLPTALARIFQPFADIPPVTGVFFEVQPGTTKVLRGEPVEFVATVTKGKVDRLRLEFRPVEGDEVGKTLWHELRAELAEGQNVANAATWKFRLPAYDSSFEYRVHGGGTWTKLAKITMLERPRIVGLQAAVTYPTYMQMPEKRLNPPDVADVSGPAGSTVEVSVNVEGDASVGEIQLLREEVRLVEISSMQRQERPWFGDMLPKGHAVEGTWEWQAPADASKSAAPAPLSARADYTAPIPGGRWHSHPVAAGLSYHLFHSAAVPFEVHLGDVLFVEVFLPADQKPEELMLQFHDGANWEHRAFWGDNKIEAGTIDTPSRRRSGDLPTAGEWVRLEVPARALDLEGRSIRGVNFSQFSGKAIWGRIGTLPPATREVREFVIAGTVPLVVQASSLPTKEDDTHRAAQSHGSQQESQAGGLHYGKHFAAVREAKHWVGAFPIEHDGWYRVELKNEIDKANLPMREARITAIPDNAPQILIERPGFDLVLSEPVNVPIVIASFDDFGLGELILSLQRGDGGFVGRPVKTFSTLTRADTALVMLDLSAEGLKNGDVLKYRAEVRDRKGQSAQTQDYQIRIVSNDPNAADKQLAQLEKKEDEFEKKLDKLIEEQAKVQEKLEKIAEKYEPLTTKIEAAQDKAENVVAEAIEKAEQAAAEQAQKDPANADKNKDNPPTKDQPKPNVAAKDQQNEKPQQPPKLDPAKLAEIAKLAEPQLGEETQKQLAELKQELGQVQQQEQKNAETAKQLDAELKDLAKEAEKQQLLPPELQREIAALSEAFKEAATEPIKNLAEEIKKSTDAKSKDPNLDQLEARADQVQENLEALKNRVEALREAQKDAKMDAAKALEQLQREMTEQRGELTAQELEQLRAAIEALREKLQKLADEEGQMLEFTPEAPESLLPEITNKQRDLERRADKELAKTKELQRRDDYKALKQKQTPQKPNPQQANDPTGDEPMSDAPEMTAEEKAEMAADLNEPDAGPTEGADEFKPVLADEPMPDAAQLDSPVDQKSKPNTKSQQKPAKDKPQAKSKDKPNSKPDTKAKSDTKTPESRREALANREEKKLDQLKKADESLAADQRALDELLGELSELMNSDGDKPSDDSPMPADAASPDQPQASEGQGEKPDAKNLPLSPEQSAELTDLLNSPKAQKAMQMAARMQALQTGESADQQAKKTDKSPSTQSPLLKSSPKPIGNLDPNKGTQFAMEAVLRDLDPATRSLILKMQPRLREELLQGLRDEGPEGYQRFIRDYFKRLTKAGQATK